MLKLLNITDIHEYNHYLNENDSIKVYKFIKRDDQLRAIGSIILQKDFIKSKYNLENYKDIVIQYTEFGKPFYGDLIYNVSHDSEMVILVYSESGSIGVDIMKRKHINIYNFYDCFSNRERYNLTQANFLSYWCAKEAFMKANWTPIEMKDIEFINGVIKYGRCEYIVKFIDIQDYCCAYITK